MSIRKRPTRAGLRRMEESGCTLDELPGPLITWQCDYRDNGGVRRHRQFPTQRQAKEFQTTALHQVATRTHTAESTMPTLAAAAQAWIARGEAEGLERSTLEQRRQHVERHIVVLFPGDDKLSKLNLDRFRDELLRTRSRAMAKRIMTSLRAILKQAKVGHLAAHVEPIATGGRHKKPLDVGTHIPTTGDIKLLLAKGGGYARVLLMLLVFAGLRMSEMRALRWQDLDLGERARLHVRERADKWGSIGKLKSEHAYRSVPLGPALVNTLRQWRLVCPRRDGELVLVLPNGGGNVENLGNIRSRVLEPLQLAAGVTIPKLDKGGKPGVDRDGKPVMRGKYSPHAFRHFFASWRIAEGDNIKRVSVLMGHSSPVITLELYTHLLPQEDEHERFAAGERALLA